MLYSEYRNKLAKWERVFTRFWHLRLLFFAIVLLVLAGIASMLGVAGMVTGAEVPATVVYGEKLGATAQSLFGRRTSFEYRPVGTETWSREEPRAAGEYECRPIGSTVVRGAYHRGSEIFTFTVLPVSVTVSVAQDRLVYGEQPAFTASLRYDDVLHVGDYTSDERNGKLILEAVGESVRVTDAEGNDVTSSYTFTTAARTVTDVDRPVTVRTASGEFVYDGRPHSCESAEFGDYGLAEGHTFEAVFPARTEAGSFSNAPESLRVFDENHIDVTDRYSFTREYGTVNISKRRIAVSTPSEQFVYDGREHTYSGFILEEGELAEGEHIELSSLLSKTDVGSFLNAPSVSVVDGEGNDRTGNYEPELRYGTVNISKRKISVSTSSMEVDYDGKEHTDSSYTLEGELALNHSIGVTDFFYRNAGTFTNSREIEIFDGEGHEQTENYEVEEKFGRVTVKKLPLSVRTYGDTLDYDGGPHSYEEFYLDSGHPADGEKIELYQPLVMTEADTYENTAFFRVVRNEDGDITTDNYEISAEYGKVVIRKLRVRVNILGESFVYDGEEHSSNLIEVLPAEGDGYSDPVKGHEISAVPAVFLTDAGEEDNDVEFFVTENGIPRTDNYEIVVFSRGKLSVTPREVTLVTRSQTFTYDGAPHSYDYFDPKESSLPLVGGHSLQRTALAWTDVNLGDDGEVIGYENIFSGISVEDGSGRDVSGNYDITWEYGTVTINRRWVQIVPDTFTAAEAVYDGTKKFKNTYTVPSGDTLVSGHYLEMKFPDITEVGSVENYFEEMKVFEGEGDAKTERTRNYELVCVHDRTLTVTPRHIRFISSDHTWVYSDEERDGLDSSIEEKYRAENVLTDLGHVFTPELESDTSILEVGSVSNGLKVVSFTVMAGETDVTRNYAIESVDYVYGTLEITPRPVTAVTESTTYVYNGVSRSYEKFHPVYSEEFPKLEGHELTVEFFGFEAKNVGKYTNDGEAFVAKGGEDVTKNYSITYEKGVIEITSRPVRLLSGSNKEEGQNIEYDGTPHSYTAYSELPAEEGEDAENYGIVTEVRHSVRVTSETYLTDAGWKENVLTFEIRDEFGEDVTGNYALTVSNGTLTVDKRQVTLKTGSLSAVYDAEPHGTDSYFEEENTLAAGHSLQRTAPAWTDVRLDSGSVVGYGNIFTEFVIRDGDGHDVTGNYIITWEYGTVTIERREVSILTDSAEKVYDAEELGADGWNYRETEYELVTEHGHELFVDGHTFIVNAEERDNEFTEYHISDGEKDVTDNYSLIISCGTLKINPRPYKVTTGSNSFVYDDEEHSEDGYTLEAESEGRGILQAHRFEATVENLKAFRFVGESEAENNVFELTGTKISGRETEGPAGDGDVTANYIFDGYIYGEVEITPRPLTVRTEDEEFVYDGTFHTFATVTPDEAGEGFGLVPGHSLKVVEISVKNVADSRDYAPEFSIVDGSESEYPEGKEFTYLENYDVTKDYGYITVSPRPLHYMTQSDSFVYDGTAHPYEKYAELLDGTALAEGHTYDFEEGTFSFETAGTHENNAVIRIYEADRTPATENYKIQRTAGTVEISRRPLGLRSESLTFTYDGGSHSQEEFKPYSVGGVEAQGLVPGHEVQVKDNTSVVFVLGEEEEYENVLTYRIYRGEEDVTENYDIRTETGKIKVLRRNIILITGGRTGEQAFEYDGEPHTVSEWFAAEETPPASGGGWEDKLAVTAKAVGPDAGTYENIFASWEILHFVLNDKDKPEGRSANNCYNIIEWKYGKIEITPRHITFKTGDGTFGYDGTEHSVPKTQAVGGNSFVLDHGVGEIKYPSFIEKGEHSNEIDRAVPIVDGAGNDVSKNYSIDVTFGTITISERPFTVTSESGEWTYDGESHDVRELTYDSSELAEGHRFEYEVSDAASVCGVGDSGKENELSFSYFRIVDENGEDVTENYTIVKEWGTLTVKNRAVSINLPDATFEYDGTEHSMYDGTEHSLDNKLMSDNLVEGHSIKSYGVADYKKGTVVSDSGSNYIILKDVVIVDGEGKDVSENYNIAYNDSPGKFVITPRKIKVRSGSVEKVYDGDEMGPLTECEVYEGKLVEGDEVLFRSILDPTNLDVGDEHLNTGKIVVTNEGFGDVTDCYEVEEYDYGTIRITRRPFTFETGSKTWVYDAGTEYSCTEYIAEEVSEGRGLLIGLGHKIVAVRSTTLSGITDSDTEVLTVDNEFIVYKIVDKLGRDITNNYEIEKITLGKLRVKTPVVIRLFGKTKEYDGEPLKYEDGDENYKLVKKPPDLTEEQIFIRLEGSLTEIGSLPLNEIIPVLYIDGEMADSEENRVQIEGSSTLTVTKRSITVVSANVRRKRPAEGDDDYGPLHGNDTGDKSLPYYLLFDNLLPGHELKCDVTGVLQPDEDSAENTIVNVHIVDEEGNDVTEYYEITIEPGVLAWLDDDAPSQISSLLPAFYLPPLKAPEGRAYLPLAVPYGESTRA